MEALTLLAHGFAVLLTWKTLALMLVGLVLGIFVGVLPGWAGQTGVAIRCSHVHDDPTPRS
jgi:TctA family transporter